MNIDVLTRKIDLTPAIDAHAKRRFRRGLRRFAPRIRRVVVRIADVNGPRGGIDKLCRATVFLDSGGTVIAEGRGDRVWRAVALAASRTSARIGRVFDDRGTRRSGRAWQRADRVLDLQMT